MVPLNVPPRGNWNHRCHREFRRWSRPLWVAELTIPIRKVYISSQGDRYVHLRETWHLWPPGSKQFPNIPWFAWPSWPRLLQSDWMGTAEYNMAQRRDSDVRNCISTATPQACKLKFCVNLWNYGSWQTMVRRRWWTNYHSSMVVGKLW